MAYLIEITKDGKFKEIFLQKKITTMGASKNADLSWPVAEGEETYFQIIQNDTHFQVLGLTPHSFIQHQGKKKQNLKLSTYDFFEIDASKFIFSQKKIQSQQSSDAMKHYESFYQFSKTLSEAKSSEDTLKKLLDLTIKVAHAQKGFLIANNKIVTSRGCNENDLKDSLDDLSKTLLRKVKETCSPVIIDNISNHPSFHPTHSVHRLDVISLACFPIIMKGKHMGYLYLGSLTAEGFFDPFTVRMIEVLLAQAALIFEQFVSREKLEKEKKELSAKLEDTAIIGASAKMEAVFQKIVKISPLDLSVLILGETGTGKELIARDIHTKSTRAKKDFITINCGAIPENLLESILFGHKKGSFTGAHEDKVGKFEAANNGTIFLDEIGEMPLQLQVKLLRVLQQRVVERVGDVKEIPINVRVIAATHQNLEKLIEQGKFREDLYYRLNEIYLEVPALREREGDVLLLAQHFLDKHKRALGQSDIEISQEAQQKMIHYSWPGNIRELENVMKRAMVFAEGTQILSTHIDVNSNTSQLLPLKEAKERFLKDYTTKVISLYDGNKDKAAEALGVSVRTLFRIDKE